MILNIRDLPEGSSQFEQQCTLDSVKECLPVLDGKVKCRGDIVRTGANIFVHAWYEGLYLLQCSRCLNDYQSTFSGEIRVIIKEVDGMHGKSEADDSVDFYFDSQDDLVDISSAFFDDIMIEMPLMPLCNEDCKGIVGHESTLSKKNEEKNNDVEIDPRWEALRKLKSK
jgi:uncharacterized protein